MIEEEKIIEIKMENEVLRRNREEIDWKDSVDKVVEVMKEGEEGLIVWEKRLRKIIMKVEIEDMEEEEKEREGDNVESRGIGIVNEGGDGRERKGNIVIDREELRILRKGNLIENFKEGMRMRKDLGNGGIMNEVIIEGLSKDGLKSSEWIILRKGRGNIDKKIKVMRDLKRIEKEIKMEKGKLKEEKRNKIEEGEWRKGMLGRKMEKEKKILRDEKEWIGKEIEIRMREDFKKRWSDEEKSKIGEEENIFKVVEGIIIIKIEKIVKDLKGRKKKLKEKEKIENIEIGKKWSEERVGEEIEKDMEWKLRKKWKRKKEEWILRRIMKVFKDKERLKSKKIKESIEVEDKVNEEKWKNDGRENLIGMMKKKKESIEKLRKKGSNGLGGKINDRRKILGRKGEKKKWSEKMIEIKMIDEIGGDILRRCERVILKKNGWKKLDKGSIRNVMYIE